jgi:hypothetical protein
MDQQTITSELSLDDAMRLISSDNTRDNLFDYIEGLYDEDDLIVD